MSSFHHVIVALLLTSLVTAAAAADPDKVDMIFWERVSRKPGGTAQRLILWANGRSEIVIKCTGSPGNPRPGWSIEKVAPYTYYRKLNPLPQAEAQKKFREAVTARIREIKTFPARYFDGGVTVVGVEVDGKLSETVVPEFERANEKDEKGSDNHTRFLMVQKILGDFDTDAIEK